MGRPVSAPDLNPEERAELERRVRATTTSQRDCLRARIVPLRADGCSLRETARYLGVSMPCVHKWSRRFDLEGLPRLVTGRVAAENDPFRKPP